MTPETWRFTEDGRSATVRPSGPLRVNNGDAMMPALTAGSGLGILPEFIHARIDASDTRQFVGGTRFSMDQSTIFL